MLDVGIIYVSKLFILGVSSSFDQATCMPFEMLINVHKLQQSRPLIVVVGQIGIHKKRWATILPIFQPLYMNFKTTTTTNTSSSSLYTSLGKVIASSTQNVFYR